MRHLACAAATCIAAHGTSPASHPRVRIDTGERTGGDATRRVDDVRQLFTHQTSRELDACYAIELAARPTSTGRMAVRFTISADGRVSEATTEGTPSSRDLARCVIATASAAIYPAAGRGSARFKFPLTFARP
jgi:hypothetical protein